MATIFLDWVFTLLEKDSPVKTQLLNVFKGHHIGAYLDPTTVDYDE